MNEKSKLRNIEENGLDQVFFPNFEVYPERSHSECGGTGWLKNLL